MRYRSKLDLLTSTILLLPFMGSVFRLISVYLASQTFNWNEVNFICLYISILIFLYVSIYYEIQESDLVISNLFFKTRIPISEIKKISKSRSFISAPALSLDRIKVESHNKFMVISPKNRKDFLTRLSAINPQIRITL